VEVGDQWLDLPGWRLDHDAPLDAEVVRARGGKQQQRRDQSNIKSWTTLTIRAAAAAPNCRWSATPVPRSKRTSLPTFRIWRTV
jgi:hypothetical protein